MQVEHATRATASRCAGTESEGEAGSGHYNREGKKRIGAGTEPEGQAQFQHFDWQRVRDEDLMMHWTGESLVNPK